MKQRRADRQTDEGVSVMFQAIEKTVMEIIADPLKIDNLQRQAHHRHVSWLKQAYDERYLAKYQWAEIGRAHV